MMRLTASLQIAVDLLPGQPGHEQWLVANLAQAPVTARDREICSRLAPTLRRHGIHLAGLDVIGSYLIEVNVTSVGALRKADALLGWTLCANLIDSVLGTQARRSA
jgi:glutathione synthase